LEDVVSKMSGTVRYVRPHRDGWIVVLELQDGEPAVGDRISAESGDAYQITSLAVGGSRSQESRRTVELQAIGAPISPLANGMRVHS